MKYLIPSLLGTSLVLSLCASSPGQLTGSDEPPKGAESIARYIDVMEKYLYVVDHVTRMSENPTAAGVAAVFQAHDLLKSQPQRAIQYFNDLLPRVRNDAVKRAIRLELAELYKNVHQDDKALEQLKELIVTTPGPARGYERGEAPRPPRPAPGPRPRPASPGGPPPPAQGQ